ncbi:MAG TPA: insulinase family protein, partial [Nannocystaceae bacterium]|nr:insulinase family protein [Nannocystaceae bacterium]
LCGAFDPEAIATLLDDRLAALGPPPPPFVLEGAPPRAIRRAQRVRVRRRKEQAHVVMAWPGLTLGDPRVPAMEVLTSVLGGQAGRLFVALREDEGLVYHTSASSTEGLDGGHVVFYAASSPDKLARAQAALERERAKICAALVDDVEIERAKAWLVGQAEAALQRRGRVASLLAFDEIYGLGYAAHRRYAERIAQIDAAHVHALAQSLLVPSRQITVVVSG